MKNSEYWKLRFAQLEEAQNKLANEGCKEIERIYRQTLKEIEGKIDTWYKRLAKNNEISMVEARKFLSGSELEEFKWDVHDYIKYGKENAVSGQWVKQLENASAKFHISKYEALKIQTQQSFENLFAKQKGITSGTMAKVYKSGYYHTAFEIQKGFGVGWDISGIDQNQVEKVLTKPWAVDGKNFSERIWSNKEKLISEVHNELTRNIITDADPQKAIDSIAKKMNTSKYNAGRLVMTEEAYFSSAAQKDYFDDLGVKEYEVVATLDSHTSDICQSMDGKHFLMSEYKAGVTAPPFHVFCRSTTCPWFDEDFGEVGERAARGEDGKTYYVPADMNYREWEDKFVNGNTDDKNTSETENKIKRKLKSVVSGNDIVDFDELNENLKREFREGLGNALPDTAKALKQQIREADFAYSNDRKSYFNKANKVVYLKPTATASTVAHELFHRLDKVNGITKNYGDKILEALQKDWNDLLRNSGNDVVFYLNKKFSEAFFKNKLGQIKIKEEYRGISDIISAVSNNKIKLGFYHSTDYWQTDGKKEAEAWAQFGRITYDNNPETIKATPHNPTKKQRLVYKLKTIMQLPKISFTRQPN